MKLEALETLVDNLTLEKEDLANSKETLELALEEEKNKSERLQEEKELQELEAEEAIIASSGDYMLDFISVIVIYRRRSW